MTKMKITKKIYVVSSDMDGVIDAFTNEEDAKSAVELLKEAYGCLVFYESVNLHE